MKIHIAKHDATAIGGGWSFTRSFAKCMADYLTSYEGAEIYFIPSASMVSKEEVEQAKACGKKIVLRCDNIIRNSRNRNSGMSRMKKFSEMADLVVFQSYFAEDILNAYLHSENFKVILNSVDQSIFNTEGREKSELTRFIYAKNSSDETKNWEMARFCYQQFYEMNKNITINLVGRFDGPKGPLSDYSFDFYNGEPYRDFGQVTDPNEMARIYKNSDAFIYTYFNDACSNTAIEAMSCGVDILDFCRMADTGGMPEIKRMFKQKGSKYFGLDRMRNDYVEALEAL